MSNIVNGIELVKTCSVSPEQYDAYKDGKKVGYLRLRNGCFTVSYPNSAGGEIFSDFPLGDGEFLDHEREDYLNLATLAINKKLGIFKGCIYCGQEKPSVDRALTMSDWISVKDRMPPEDDVILISNGIYVEKGFLLEGVFRDMEFFELLDVKYWQPWPKPPSEIK